MRTTTWLAWAMLGIGTTRAQVHVDQPLVLTASDSAQRSIIGLAPARQANALIALKEARDGRYTWAQTGGTPMAITLAMDPPCTAYAPGLSIRFLPQANAAGLVTLNVDGLGARRLVNGDRQPMSFGQVTPGRVLEVVYADTCFVLHDRAPEGCPPGFLAASERLCFQQNDTSAMSIFNANKWCQDRGARICTWDEYIHACTTLQPQLQGLFDDWEWVDDSSDHTHTADQMARYNCRGLRDVSAVENNNNYGNVRCCYHRR